MKKRKAPVVPIAILVILLTGVAVFNAASVDRSAPTEDPAEHAHSTAPSKSTTADDLVKSVSASGEAKPMKPVSSEPLIKSTGAPQKEAPNPNAPSGQWYSKQAGINQGH